LESTFLCAPRPVAVDLIVTVVAGERSPHRRLRHGRLRIPFPRNSRLRPRDAWRPKVPWVRIGLPGERGPHDGSAGVRGHEFSPFVSTRQVVGKVFKLAAGEFPSNHPGSRLKSWIESELIPMWGVSGRTTEFDRIVCRKKSRLDNRCVKRWGNSGVVVPFYWQRMANRVGRLSLRLLEYLIQIPLILLGPVEIGRRRRLYHRRGSRRH